jgi:hypothetical protein
MWSSSPSCIPSSSPFLHYNSCLYLFSLFLELSGCFSLDTHNSRYRVKSLWISLILVNDPPFASDGLIIIRLIKLVRFRRRSTSPTYIHDVSFFTSWFSILSWNTIFESLLGYHFIKIIGTLKTISIISGFALFLLCHREQIVTWELMFYQVRYIVSLTPRRL